MAYDDDSQWLSDLALARVKRVEPHPQASPCEQRTTISFLITVAQRDGSVDELTIEVVHAVSAPMPYIEVAEAAWGQVSGLVNDIAAIGGGIELKLDPIDPTSTLWE